MSMYKILFILLSLLSLNSLASNPENDTIIIACGMMRYIPMHDSTKHEKLYRKASGVEENKTITISITLNCNGEVIDVHHDDYHD